MKYRVKEIIDDEGTKFYPQYRRLFIWWYYTYTCGFDIYSYTVKKGFDTLEGAQKYIAYKKREAQPSRIKVHEIPETYDA